jgi:hypothetical protein
MIKNDTPLFLRALNGETRFGMVRSSIQILVLIMIFIGNLDPSYLGGYKIGYELLPLNGLLTFIGLILIRRK